MAFTCVQCGYKMYGDNIVACYQTSTTLQTEYCDTIAYINITDMRLSCRNMEQVLILILKFYGRSHLIHFVCNLGI